MSMSAVHGWRLGGDVCDALGLDKSQVRSLKIDLSVNAPARVTAEMWIPAENGLGTVLREYELIEREDEASDAA